MLFYSVFLLPVFAIKIPYMTLFLGVLTLLSMSIDMYTIRFNLCILLTKEVLILSFFILYCTITSIFFASSIQSSIAALIQLSMNTMLLAVTIYLICQDKSIKYCVWSFVAIMSCMAIYALTNAGAISTRLSLSENSNSNVLGHNALCAFVFLSSFFQGRKKLLTSCILIMSVAFLITIILSGSRVSLICALLYYYLFYIKILPNILQTKRSRTKTLKIFLISFFTFTSIFFIFPLFQESLIYNRMLSLYDVFEGQSGDGVGRLFLYKKALEMFLTNPLFGVGYGNYAVLHHGVYSHSTYAEVLACTGIFGSLIMIVFFYNIYVSHRKLLYKPSIDLVTHQTLLSMFFVILLLGIGEIILYKINYFIILGIFSGYILIAKEKEIRH